MPNLIAQTLSSVTLGEPSTHESLTMFPLLGEDVADEPPFYLTLDQALSERSTEVTEVSDQGSVPNLVDNKGAKPVFILDGEELVGAKQNRVVNLSILVPARSELTIPVSCVEAGRWRARSRAFSSAPRTQYAAVPRRSSGRPEPWSKDGRAMRMRQVTESMQVSGLRQSDQAAVWADIAEKSARMGAESPSGAMEEIFAVHAKFAERCLKALSPSERQCGALFMIGGRVVGFDLFDRAVTLRRLLPKLVRSVAMDAIDDANPRSPDREVGLEPAPDRRRSRRAPVSPDLLLKVAEHFLESTCAADVHEDDAVGMGRDLRLSAPTISGAALVANTTIVHLSAFHV